MVNIRIGYWCGDSCDCDMRGKCKYRGRYKFHNMSVSIHRFFQYRLHIKLPHLIYIGQKHARLSGTDKCPFKKSRHYTCHDCKHLNGFDACRIPFAERKECAEDDEWGKHSKCGSFEKDAWADDFLY